MATSAVQPGIVPSAAEDPLFALVQARMKPILRFAQDDNESGPGIPGLFSSKALPAACYQITTR